MRRLSGEGGIRQEREKKASGTAVLPVAASQRGILHLSSVTHLAASWQPRRESHE